MGGRQGGRVISEWRARLELTDSNHALHSHCSTSSSPWPTSASPGSSTLCRVVVCVATKCSLLFGPLQPAAEHSQTSTSRSSTKVLRGWGWVWPGSLGGGAALWWWGEDCNIFPNFSKIVFQPGPLPPSSPTALNKPFCRPSCVLLK